MLFDEDVTKAVCDTLRAKYRDSGREIPPLVVDPVCVSTSGHQLLKDSAISVVVEELFPLARIITPNKQEAERILGEYAARDVSIQTMSDMCDASENLAKLGPREVLLKGGHLTFYEEELSSFCKNNNKIEVRRPLLSTEIKSLAAAQSILYPNSLSDTLQSLVVDVLYQRELAQWTFFARTRIDSKNTHGTGCTLSAAICCELARGASSKSTIT